MPDSTMTETGSPGDFQRSTRMPLDAVVRLHFEGTVAYQNGFAANVSASGMFVKHPEPPPVGTRLVFEFGIGSQRRPVQGAGEVVWTREKYEGPGRPAGAGIRFVELDELSRQHLAEALFEFLEASLGDRVAEHPEVADLVSSVPTHAPPDFDLPEPAASEAAASGSEVLPDISDVAPEPSGEFTPFRIFDEEPGPYRPRQDLGTVRVEIPRAASPAPEPAIPSAPEPWSEPDSYAGAAVAPDARGSRWPLVAGITVLVLAAAAFAGWWFYLREAQRLEGETAAPTEATAPAPAEAPAPLDPEPGPETTLAESVGAQREAPGAARPTTAPAPEPPAAATEPAASAAPAARVGRLEGIRVLATGSGTEVTLSGDGFFPEGSYSWSEIGGDKPRVLIRLKGIEEPFRGAVGSVPTDAVANVRTGYHQQAGGNELHVVIDLAPARRVTVESVEPAGTGLVVRLALR